MGPGVQALTPVTEEDRCKCRTYWLGTSGAATGLDVVR
jgi:hypothetical protein